MKPRPYQIVGRDFLAERRHALLADAMRVGKTGQAILAADQIGARYVLTVGPAIAGPVWVREWAKWSPGRAAATILDARGDIGAERPVFASFDMALKHRKLLSVFPWDLVIVDECHFARNPQALRTQMIYGKNGLGWAADRMWVLSGTPAVKHAAELWAMFRAFGATDQSYDEFVADHCLVHPNTGRIVSTTALGAEKVRAILRSIMLRRTLRDVAPELPRIQFNPLYITGSPPAGCDPNVSDAELLEYLARSAEHDATLRHETAMAKVPAVADNVIFAIKNGLLDRTVVFGHHTAPLKALCALLDTVGITTALLTGQTSTTARVRTQDEFAAGRLQVVAANILAAGTAIDMSAARHGYFLEMDWLPANNLQAAHRLIHLGITDPTTFDVATWAGSFDERVGRTLIRRAQELEQLGLA